MGFKGLDCYIWFSIEVWEESVRGFARHVILVDLIINERLMMCCYCRAII